VLGVNLFLQPATHLQTAKWLCCNCCNWVLSLSLSLCPINLGDYQS